MSRTSSTYVSPNLGPTAPWGQQTSTGVFRPPPPITLNASAEEVSRHDGKSPPPSYAASGMEPPLDHGLAPGPSHSYGNVNSISYSRQSDGGSYAAPSPPLQTTSPPFYPQNHYGNVPAALSLAPHGMPLPLTNGDNTNGCSSAVSADRLMKMISYSVHREEDAFLAKKESNRVLEKELQHEQEQRRETQRQLELVDEALQILRRIRDGQSQLAAQLRTTL